ncbi:MAG TPA: hypothetical protein DCM54_06010 [Gammaproteobacteria bacterium]|nr:hypothetical protein [Gammaproteobacteria bacterium]
MDIQVASNFERYLFYELNQSSGKVVEFMEQFQSTGTVSLGFNTRRQNEAFLAGAADDEQTIETIKRCHADYGYLVDPHTAVGIEVASKLHREDLPLLCLSTAYPAKFQHAMHRALPEIPVEHPTLNALKGLPERKQVMDVDEAAVKAYLAGHAL